MKKHYPFPKIRQYHQVLRDLKLRAQYGGKDPEGNPVYDSTVKLPLVHYRGRVKLHGTNASIVFMPDGTFYCQSRERVIDQDSDNAGFASWVQTHREKLLDMFRSFGNRPFILYGEWCGGSIQKSVALNELTKRFVVFGAKFDSGDDTYEWIDEDRLFRFPDIGFYNISSFPSFDIDIDLEKPEQAIEEMIELTTKVGDQCPVGAAFGVNGTGEGIVWRPVDDHSYGFAFKTKDERHSISKIKKLPTADIEKIESLRAAVELHVHEDRLIQCYDKVVLTEADKVPTNIAAFIRLVIEDTWSEEEDTLLASGITKKDFGSGVSKVAARWFQTQITKL